MEIQERKAWLREMMAEYQVNAKQVAEILGRDVHTIRMWRSVNPRGNATFNELRLLKFELEARKAKPSTNEKTLATANS